MWETEPIVLQLIKYMESRGCDVELGSMGPSEIPGIYFILTDESGEFAILSQFVWGEDIYNALHAAYRVAWEPNDIAKRFERYLIDLHNKRNKHE